MLYTISLWLPCSAALVKRVRSTERNAGSVGILKEGNCSTRTSPLHAAQVVLCFAVGHLICGVPSLVSFPNTMTNTLQSTSSVFLVCVSDGIVGTANFAKVQTQNKWHTQKINELLNEPWFMCVLPLRSRESVSRQTKVCRCYCRLPTLGSVLCSTADMNVLCNTGFDFSHPISHKVGFIAQKRAPSLAFSSNVFFPTRDEI